MKILFCVTKLCNPHNVSKKTGKYFWTSRFVTFCFLDRWILEATYFWTSVFRSDILSEIRGNLSRGREKNTRSQSFIAARSFRNESSSRADFRFILSARRCFSLYRLSEVASSRNILSAFGTSSKCKQLQTISFLVIVGNLWNWLKQFFRWLLFFCWL